MNEKDVEIVFKFFISSGLVDRNREVQSEMLNSALQVVNHHGQVGLSSFAFQFIDDLLLN